MSAESQKPSIGKAIDDVINALNGLDTPTRIIVIRAVCSHLSIPLESIDPGISLQRTSQTTIDPNVSTRSIHRDSDSGVIDIKTFKEQKQPSSAREMACVIAFYLQSVAPAAERKLVISGDDLDKYFRQASFKLPKVPQQVLIDSRAAGYFDSAGQGLYKLNAVGYNLVAHNLPRVKSLVKHVSAKRTQKGRKK